MIKKSTFVIIPAEIMKRIEDHANISWMYYPNPNNRTEFQIKKDIIRGKMGEYGYYIMAKNAGYSNITEPDLKTYKNGDDGGNDFIQNNKRLDIKTLDVENHGYYKVPLKPNLRSDAYVLCWVNMNTKKVIYEGAITRDEIINKNLLIEDLNQYTHKPYYYVNKYKLRELNENFE